MGTFNKKYDNRACDEILECESYLAVKAGENCADCGMRRIPEEYAETVYRDDAELLNEQLPESATNVQCKRLKI